MAEGSLCFMTTPAIRTAAAFRRHRGGGRIDTKLKWYGEKIAKGLKVEMSNRLTVIGGLLRDRIRAHISIPVGYIIGPRGGIKITERSKPGEHPRTQAALPEGGRLIESIFSRKLSPLWVRVGTTLDYGMYLEIGTRNMAPRPYILRTLLEQIPAIRRIVQARIEVIPGVPTATASAARAA